MTSDPDQIRSDIERTQLNLGADVDALTDKVSPPRSVERRVQRTRSAMTSFKDRIMGGTSGHTSNLSDTVGSSASSAKDSVAGAASSAADAAGSAPDVARPRPRGHPPPAGPR